MCIRNYMCCKFRNFLGSLSRKIANIFLLKCLKNSLYFFLLVVLENCLVIVKK